MYGCVKKVDGGNFVIWPLDGQSGGGRVIVYMTVGGCR